MRLNKEKNFNFLRFLRKDPLYIPIYKEIDLSKFNHVRADNKSLEILNSAPTDSRFVVIYFWHNDCWNIRLAIGLEHDDNDKEKRRGLENKFGETRVIKVINRLHPGVVHKKLLSNLHSIEKGKEMCDAYAQQQKKLIFLGSSFKLLINSPNKEKLIIGTNRSGQNENFFFMNKLTRACFSHSLSHRVKNQQKIKVTSKLSTRVIHEMVVKQVVYLVLSDKSKSCDICYSPSGSNELKKIKFHIEGNEQLERMLFYSLKERLLANHDRFNLFELVNKNKIRREKLRTIQAQIRDLIAQDDYYDCDFSQYPSYYTDEFIQGARNMSKDHYLTLTKASIECFNRALEKGHPYSFKLHEERTLSSCDSFKRERLWGEVISKNNAMITSLLAKNLIMTATKDMHTLSQSKEYTEQFYNLLDLLERSRVDLFSYKFEEKMLYPIKLASTYSINKGEKPISPAHRNIYFYDIRVSKDEEPCFQVDVWGRDFFEIFISFVIKENENPDLFKLIDLLENGSSIKVGFEFFVELSKEIGRNKEISSEYHFSAEDKELPLFMLLYATAVRNENYELVGILEEKLFHYKKGEIKLILEKGIEYSVRTRNPFLYDCLDKFYFGLFNEKPSKNDHLRNDLTYVNFEQKTLTDIDFDFTGALLTPQQMKNFYDAGYRDFSGIFVQSGAAIPDGFNLCGAYLEGTQFDAHQIDQLVINGNRVLLDLKSGQKGNENSSSHLTFFQHQQESQLAEFDEKEKTCEILNIFVNRIISLNKSKFKNLQYSPFKLVYNKRNEVETGKTKANDEALILDPEGVFIETVDDCMGFLSSFFDDDRLEDSLTAEGQAFNEKLSGCDIGDEEFLQTLQNYSNIQLKSFLLNESDLISSQVVSTAKCH